MSSVSHLRLYNDKRLSPAIHLTNNHPRLGPFTFLRLLRLPADAEKPRRRPATVKAPRLPLHTKPAIRCPRHANIPPYPNIILGYAAAKPQNVLRPGEGVKTKIAGGAEKGVGGPGRAPARGGTRAPGRSAPRRPAVPHRTRLDLAFPPRISLSRGAISP